MTVLISALAFLLLLSVLVLLHELGHFTAARRAGVIVEEFGFGLPPRAKTLFKRGGTLFSLNWIPFGGFVRLKGENAATERERTAPGSFGSASYPARVLILTAGVLMNLLFALVIFTIGFSAGRWIPTYISFDEMKSAAARGDISMTPTVLVDEVVADGGAARAGVPPQSLLIKVDGKPVSDPTEVATLQVGKSRVSYTVLTGKDYSETKTFTVPVSKGRTGVALRTYIRNLSAPNRSIGDALLLSLREAWVMMVQTIRGIGKLFLSLAQTGRVPEGITGIVGIAQLTHGAVQQGFMVYLRLVALLSLSLAVLNILPLPALDGGRLLFVLVELIRRRPANRRFEVTTNAVGFAFLILLILLITYHDIVRLFF
jgi:regulator of sigma E protease